MSLKFFNLYISLYIIILLINDFKSYKIIKKYLYFKKHTIL